MTNQTNDVIRDAKQLGIPKMLILGLQHMFAMFGATILVPILVNSYFTDACGEGPTHGLTVAVTVLCRFRHSVIPCVLQVPGSCISWIFLCFPRGIFNSSQPEHRYVCNHEC